MNIAVIISIIIIVISLIGILFTGINTKFQINIIRLNEAEANIDAALRKRYDILNKCINIIKNNTDEKKVLENIKKSRSKKLNMFELDHELNKAMEELNEYIKKYPNLEKIEQFRNINLNLLESESEINAFKQYYHDIATSYNKMVKSFPGNIEALFKGYKVKAYFENENTSN